jgi:hypothetical protein
MSVFQKFVSVGMLVSSLLLAVSVEPHEKDKMLMIYLGKGTKLVLKTDLFIPANSAKLVFPVTTMNKYPDYCAIEFEPSQEDRRLSAGRAIVLSGKQLNGYPMDDFIVMSMEVQEPSAFKAVSCQNTWDGKITIGTLRTAFAGKADLVFPEPSEITER